MRRTHAAAVGAVMTLGLALTSLPASAETGAPPSGGRADHIGKGRATALADAQKGARADILPPTDEDRYFRIAGANRYETAVEISLETICAPTDAPADCYLGGSDEPVETVFVASALNYPDALGAGPVAAGLGPLLLVPSTGTVPAVVKNELNRIKPKDIVVFGGTTAVSNGVVSQIAGYASEGVSRVAGSDRYATAAQAALLNDELWRNSDDDGDGQPDDVGTDTVVIAAGLGFADSLGGGGAAANARGSLMLTAKSSLPASTRSALVSIKPNRVIVLGGTGVVAANVEAAIKTAVPTASVVRAAGSDRFGTAIQLSKTVFPEGAPEVFLVNGFNFPDALASAPAAGLWGASTLVSRQPCVTSATRAEASRIDPDYVTGFGGETVLSDNAILFVTC